ncbi:MerR family transcriptional regulator [Streptomyces albipurpureus]|uniref:MerR family transcriptional regulator n=1 Tax=Streptomyces albipurpureus TaxID=2897419 RepID=A0ABT0UPV9_9ACTN|nr:MerR family transcriptional regulator [Streptomyces sp. CWNU-1]MCM2390392.1 MerR family transcriptional regulator [Streptomyces sp. CWNU-1]
MRIGELSRRTGVPVPTIKYYVREGLLPAGQLTSPNQAAYGEAHERRLRLIRALLDVGGLKVAAIAEVLAAVDDPAKSIHKVLGVASDLLVPRYPAAEPDEALLAAREQVDELVTQRGWQDVHDCPAKESLAMALATLRRVGHEDFVQVLDVYAEAAEEVARADLEAVAARSARSALDGVVESVIVGTVVGEAMFSALRHLAHVDRSSRMYGEAASHGQAAAGGDGEITR